MSNNQQPKALTHSHTKQTKKKDGKVDLMHFGTSHRVLQKEYLFSAPCEKKKKKATYSIRFVFPDGGLEPSVSVLEMGEHGGVEWPCLANKTGAIEGQGHVV